MRWRTLGAAACCAVLVTGCTAIPELPDEDYGLPTREILVHTACELRKSFEILNHKKEYSKFGAGSWAISVSLTPKVDREVTAGVGLTGKNTSNPAVKHIRSWTIGTAPGAQIQVKGHRDGSVSYTILSRELLDRTNNPLECETETPNYHALAQHLGIAGWLTRTVSAMGEDIAKFARLDKPTFNSEIYIKFNGSAGFTYQFPLGSEFASIGGSHVLTETLSIALTPVPPTYMVSTLPSGGEFGASKKAAVSASGYIDPQFRLDQLQLEQTLRNLRIRVDP